MVREVGRQGQQAVVGECLRVPRAAGCRGGEGRRGPQGGGGGGGGCGRERWSGNRGLGVLGTSPVGIEGGGERPWSLTYLPGGCRGAGPLEL